jgi:hypothetical protein
MNCLLFFGYVIIQDATKINTIQTKNRLVPLLFDFFLAWGTKRHFCLKRVNVLSDIHILILLIKIAFNFRKRCVPCSDFLYCKILFYLIKAKKQTMQFSGFLQRKETFVPFSLLSSLILCHFLDNLR